MQRTIKHKTTAVTLAAYMMLMGNGFAATGTVFTEEMTSPEIRARIQAGATTVIIPTGGTEQNGPQMVTGKHNFIMHYTAGEIAKRLGKTLVVPVMAYVPEGSIEPPEGHMNFAGTLSLRPETFSAVLEDTARSLKQHGFTRICFLGEHGASQQPQKQLAEKLNSEWKLSGVQVVDVSDYYANNGQDAWVQSQKIVSEEPGAHAGFEDTSELMAVQPSAVRESLRGKHGPADYKIIGATGDSSLASASYGRHLLGLKIDAAVKQIQHATPQVIPHAATP